MIETILSVGLFFFIYWGAMVFGYYVSEFCVKPFGLFDVYPWVCRKCATTQTMIALYIAGAIILSSWWFFLCGMGIALAQAECFIITEKKKGLQ